MVSFDDKTFLLNYVRKCFATGDDTTFCEFLLDGQEDLDQQDLIDILEGNGSCAIINTEADNFHRYSPECPFIPCEALKLDDSLSDKDSVTGDGSQNGVQLSQNQRVRQLSAEEIDDYFPSKPIIRTQTSSGTNTKPEKSGLTLALEQAKLDGLLKRNRLFSDFAVHDARSATPTTVSSGPNDGRYGFDCLDPSVRQFNVWFWRLTDIPRTSIRVQPRLGTTVRQFVGLTLWQYFNELGSSDTDKRLSARLDSLDESYVDHIALYMLDISDDDVDSEFPPLEPTDPIHKYEFDCLALVERLDVQLPNNTIQEITQVFVSIYLPQGSSKLRFTTDTPLSTVLEYAVRRRRLRQHSGYEYRLERWPLPAVDSQLAKDASSGQRLDLTQRLCDFIAAGIPLQFALVRENSRYESLILDSPDEDEQPELAPQPVIQVPQLRQYRVTYLKGLFPREVQLNVSADGIKLEQITSRRPKLFSKPTKPIKIPIQSVAHCELVNSGLLSSGSGTSTDSGTGWNRQSTTSIGGPPTDQQDSVPQSFLTGKVQVRIIYLPDSTTDNSNSSTGFNWTKPTNTTTTPNINQPNQRATIHVGNNSITSNMNNSTTTSSSLDSVNFHQLCLETQWARARAICDQLIVILDECGSQARQLFMKQRLAAVS